MKKKIISICITLFLLFCSVVPTFALDTVINSQCDYWIYDLMLQTVNENTSDATWGYVLDNSNNPTMGYYAMVLDIGSAAIYEYNVKPGETVYFRWGVSNFFQASGTTTVKTVVNGTVVNTSNYTIGSGEYNSGYSVFICDDYTNTSNITQTVTYSLRNGNDLTTTYIPVKCGLEIYFDSVVGEVTGDTTVDIDLSYIESSLDIISSTVSLNNISLLNIDSKLSSIYNILDSISSDIKTLLQYVDLWESVPIDFTKVYTYCFNGLNARFINGFDNTNLMFDNVLPYLVIDNSYNSYSSNRSLFVREGEFYFSYLFHASSVLGNVQNNVPQLIFDNGERSSMSLRKLDKFGANYIGTYSYDFSKLDNGRFFSLYLPYTHKFIPIYFGYPYLDYDISDTQMIMSGFNYSDNNLKDNTSQFVDSANKLETFEKNQISNMSESLNNIPSLDFNSFNDFAPTVQFVSGTLQQIYESNRFLQLLINSGLVIGIALLIIGRGTKK